MKALKKYLKKRKSAILFLLEKQQKSFTPDTFHTLRIEIKKLNALLDLINFCFKNFRRKKTFKPFKLIFCQAGKVRNLQVEETLLEDYFAFNFITQYRNDLKKNLAKELHIFFIIINDYCAKELKKRCCEINSFLAKTSKKKANHFMNKKRTKIKKLLRQKALKKEQMHTLRKRLKKYQYNQKSLNYAKKNKLISKKNTLPELLGEWHDYRMVIQHLKKAIESEEINPKESSQLENSIVTFTFKSQQLFNKINATLSYQSFFRNQ
ncbi:MAG: CHAD domain-containing protein [bacterium]|nr:CHAD domain-containing protein [bacterium]